jgi:hypothetical protein
MDFTVSDNMFRRICAIVSSLFSFIFYQVLSVNFQCIPSGSTDVLNTIYTILLYTSTAVCCFLIYKHCSYFAKVADIWSQRMNSTVGNLVMFSADSDLHLWAQRNMRSVSILFPEPFNPVSSSFVCCYQLCCQQIVIYTYGRKEIWDLFRYCFLSHSI